MRTTGTLDARDTAPAPRPAAALAAALPAACAAAASAAPLPGAPGCPVLPPGNVWNARVDRLPVRADSAALPAAVGLDAAIHPDFSAAGRYGIPVNVVGRATRAGRCGST